MKFPLHFLPKAPPHYLLLRRSITSSTSPTSSIKWVRDRALDHAVEKERNLQPLLNLKNLLNTSPSKSLPLSQITKLKNPLHFPTRPIDFVRKFPLFFQEFLPSPLSTDPHIKLTPNSIDIDSQEHLLFHSDDLKKDAADRLLKLLMIGKVRKLPLPLLDVFKWDLGLPNDYEKTLIPEFPDYFQVVRSRDVSRLELVCWSNELAVSEIEKRAVNDGVEYRKGMPIALPLQYSRGFEVDKKFKRWVDEWQKLPYVSPYENVGCCEGDGVEMDKWVVGMLHEVLSILVPKKTEKENLLWLGEYMGLRSRFKRALLQHPGIFYVSSKLRTHTVVLREGYKRDLLVGKSNPVMEMRSKYIHLMNMVKEEDKAKSEQASSNTRKKKASKDSKEGDGEHLGNEEGGEEEDGSGNHMSDSEFEDESDNDDYDDDEEEDDEDDNESDGESTRIRERTNRKPKFEEKRRPLRNENNQSGRRNPDKNQRSPTFARGKESPMRNERKSSDGRYPNRSLDPKSPAFSRENDRRLRNERTPSDRRYPNTSPNKQPATFSRGKESALRTEKIERYKSDGRYPSKSQDKGATAFSKGKESPQQMEQSRSGRVYHNRNMDKESPAFSRGKERPSRNEPTQYGRRYTGKTTNRNAPSNSRGKEMSSRQNFLERPNGRADVSGKRETTD